MIALVTDSSIGLTREQSRKLGVHLVCMSYCINGNSYIENYSEENGEYASLISKFPDTCSSSQASIHQFTRMFKHLVARGYDVVCPVISSRLSGTYSCAVLAALNVNPAKISVIDTKTAGGGLYFLLEKASYMIKQGYSLAAVTSDLEKSRGKIGVVLSLSEITVLRRSGRMPLVRQSISPILNMHPLVKLQDGALVLFKTVRGHHEEARELINAIPQDASCIIIYALTRSSMVELLKDTVLSSRPNIMVKTSVFGPVLAANVGPGALAITWSCL